MSYQIFFFVKKISSVLQRTEMGFMIQKRPKKTTDVAYKSAQNVSVEEGKTAKDIAVGVGSSIRDSIVHSFNGRFSSAEQQTEKRFTDMNTAIQSTFGSNQAILTEFGVSLENVGNEILKVRQSHDQLKEGMVSVKNLIETLPTNPVVVEKLDDLGTTLENQSSTLSKLECRQGHQDDDLKLELQCIRDVINRQQLQGAGQSDTSVVKTEEVKSKVLAGNIFSDSASAANAKQNIKKTKPRAEVVPRDANEKNETSVSMFDIDSMRHGLKENTSGDGEYFFNVDRPAWLVGLDIGGAAYDATAFMYVIITCYDDDLDIQLSATTPTVKGGGPHHIRFNNLVIFRPGRTYKASVFEDPSFKSDHGKWDVFHGKANRNPTSGGVSFTFLDVNERTCSMIGKMYFTPILDRYPNSEKLVVPRFGPKVPVYKLGGSVDGEQVAFSVNREILTSGVIMTGPYNHTATVKIVLTERKSGCEIASAMTTIESDDQLHLYRAEFEAAVPLQPGREYSVSVSVPDSSAAPRWWLCSGGEYRYWTRDGYTVVTFCNPESVSSETSGSIKELLFTTIAPP